MLTTLRNRLFRFTNNQDANGSPPSLPEALARELLDSPPSAEALVRHLSCRVYAGTNLNRLATIVACYAPHHAKRQPFIRKYRIAVNNYHQVSLDLGTTPPIRFLRQVLALTDDSYQIEDWMWRNWNKSKNFGICLRKPLYIDGHVPHSVGLCRQAQKEHHQIACFPTLPQLAVAHAGFYLASGNHDLFCGAPVRAARAALGFDARSVLLHPYSALSSDSHLAASSDLNHSTREEPEIPF